MRYLKLSDELMNNEFLFSIRCRENRGYCLRVHQSTVWAQVSERAGVSVVIDGLVVMYQHQLHSIQWPVDHPQYLACLPYRQQPRRPHLQQEVPLVLLLNFPDTWDSHQVLPSDEHKLSPWKWGYTSTRIPAHRLTIMMKTVIIIIKMTVDCHRSKSSSEIIELEKLPQGLGILSHFSGSF